MAANRAACMAFSCACLSWVISRWAASRDALDREVATLLERLLTDSCRKQSSEAFKYEGAIAFQQSFGTLGQVAMHELMADRNVAASFQSFVKYLDKTKLQSIGIEQ